MSNKKPARLNYQRLLMVEGKRECNLCMVIKPLEDFGAIKKWKKGDKYGVPSYCKSCRVRKEKMRKYLLTYEQVIDYENKECEVCSSKESLHIDHSHETGKVRGILCSNCNYAEGFIKSNYELALKLADYIKRTN